jgi:PEP-CTERM motif
MPLALKADRFEVLTMKHLIFAGLLLMLLSLPNHANAQILTGETITTTYLFPDTSTVYAGPTATLIPSGGITISNFASFTDINFSANNILITADRNAGINAVSFDGFEFFDPSGIFSSVTLNPSSTYAGLLPSNISFDANHIFVNVVGLPGLTGQTILLNINTPEPATMLIFGTGLLAIAGFLRRKKPLHA